MEERFFYIDDLGNVFSAIKGALVDSVYKEAGNYYLSRDEAETAARMVRKALKGVDENKLLREALEEAVSMYGKPGGPWNVPGDAGRWISKARKALEVENE
jgi:hypothetical protein|nr:MAG TPA: hypothetical protein [Caudoviricetes sp.]